MLCNPAYVQNFHGAKLQALGKMQMTSNQPKYSKTENLLRTEQRYGDRTAIKINTVDARLHLFIAS